jgi:hypothetical protein
MSDGISIDTELIPPEKRQNIVFQKNIETQNDHIFDNKNAPNSTPPLPYIPMYLYSEVPFESHPIPMLLNTPSPVTTLDLSLMIKNSPLDHFSNFFSKNRPENTQKDHPKNPPTNPPPHQTNPHSYKSDAPIDNWLVIVAGMTMGFIRAEIRTNHFPRSMLNMTHDRYLQRQYHEPKVWDMMMTTIQVPVVKTSKIVVVKNIKTGNDENDENDEKNNKNNDNYGNNFDQFNASFLRTTSSSSNTTPFLGDTRSSSSSLALTGDMISLLNSIDVGNKLLAQRGIDIHQNNGINFEQSIPEDKSEIFLEQSFNLGHSDSTSLSPKSPSSLLPSLPTPIISPMNELGLNSTMDSTFFNQGSGIENNEQNEQENQQKKDFVSQNSLSSETSSSPPTIRSTGVSLSINSTPISELGPLNNPVEEKKYFDSNFDQNNSQNIETNLVLPNVPISLSSTSNSSPSTTSPDGIAILSSYSDTIGRKPAQSPDQFGSASFEGLEEAKNNVKNNVKNNAQNIENVGKSNNFQNEIQTTLLDVPKAEIFFQPQTIALHQYVFPTNLTPLSQILTSWLQFMSLTGDYDDSVPTGDENVNKNCKENERKIQKVQKIQKNEQNNQLFDFSSQHSHRDISLDTHSIELEHYLQGVINRSQRYAGFRRRKGFIMQYRLSGIITNFATSLDISFDQENLPNFEQNNNFNQNEKNWLPEKCQYCYDNCINYEPFLLVSQLAPPEILYPMLDTNTKCLCHEQLENPSPPLPTTSPLAQNNTLTLSNPYTEKVAIPSVSLIVSTSNEIVLFSKIQTQLLTSATALFDPLFIQELYKSYVKYIKSYIFKRTVGFQVFLKNEHLYVCPKDDNDGVLETTDYDNNNDVYHNSRALNMSNIQNNVEKNISKLGQDLKNPKIGNNTKVISTYDGNPTIEPSPPTYVSGLGASLRESKHFDFSKIQIDPSGAIITTQPQINGISTINQINNIQNSGHNSSRNYYSPHFGAQNNTISSAGSPGSPFLHPSSRISISSNASSTPTTGGQTPQMDARNVINTAKNLNHENENEHFEEKNQSSSSGSHLHQIPSSKYVALTDSTALPVSLVTKLSQTNQIPMSYLTNTLESHWLQKHSTKLFLSPIFFNFVKQKFVIIATREGFVYLFKQFFTGGYYCDLSGDCYGRGYDDHNESNQKIDPKLTSQKTPQNSKIPNLFNPQIKALPHLIYSYGLNLDYKNPLFPTPSLTAITMGPQPHDVRSVGVPGGTNGLNDVKNQCDVSVNGGGNGGDMNLGEKNQNLHNCNQNYQPKYICVRVFKTNSPIFAMQCHTGVVKKSYGDEGDGGLSGKGQETYFVNKTPHNVDITSSDRIVPRASVYLSCGSGVVVLKIDQDDFD